LNTDYEARLNAINALTDAVGDALSGGDWLAASALEDERRAALEALVATMTGGEGAAADVRVVLDGLQRRTQLLIGEAHHHRHRVVREASTIRTGRKAAHEYTASAKAR
jgi:hypothetical protein